MTDLVTDLEAITQRILTLAKAAADQRAMPDPAWDYALRQVEQDLDALLAPPEALTVRLSSIIPGDLVLIGEDDFREVLEIGPKGLILTNPKPWPKNVATLTTPLAGTFITRKRRPGE